MNKLLIYILFIGFSAGFVSAQQIPFSGSYDVYANLDDCKTGEDIKQFFSLFVRETLLFPCTLSNEDLKILSEIKTEKIKMEGSLFTLSFEKNTMTVGDNIFEVSYHLLAPGKYQIIAKKFPNCPITLHLSGSGIHNLSFATSTCWKLTLKRQ